MILVWFAVMLVLYSAVMWASGWPAYRVTTISLLVAMVAWLTFGVTVFLL